MPFRVWSFFFFSLEQGKSEGQGPSYDPKAANTPGFRRKWGIFLARNRGRGIGREFKDEVIKTEVGLGLTEKEQHPINRTAVSSTVISSALSLQAVGLLSCKATVTETPSSADGV